MRELEAPGNGGPIHTWIASPAGAGDEALPTIVEHPRRPARRLGAGAVDRGRCCSARAATASSSRTSADRRATVATGSGRTSATGVVLTPRTSTRRSITSIALGLADADRLGALGLSYGGFMVNWLMGTTDRFKAGRQRRGRDEPGLGLVGRRRRGRVQPDGPAGRSALVARACRSSGGRARCRTWPTFGRRSCSSRARADLRCMPEDNVQLFTALRVLGRTVEYVLYPEESHVYFTAGRPGPPHRPHDPDARPGSTATSAASTTAPARLEQVARDPLAPVALEERLAVELDPEARSSCRTPTRSRAIGAVGDRSRSVGRRWSSR